MPPSAAQSLVSLIAHAVEDIEADTASQIPGGVTTDVNVPEVAPEDGLDITPMRRAAIRTLKAATYQLLATLMPAGLQLQDVAMSCFQTVTINIAVRARIADLIHAIDPDSTRGGAKVEELAEQAGMDAHKLTRVMRFLALRNIFRELTPGRWANTRLSVPLRSDSPNTQCNLLTRLFDEAAVPALMELPNVLMDKVGGAALGWDARQSAFQRYYKSDGDYFDFLAKSEGGDRANSFGKAMVEASRMNGSDFNGFEWQKLGPNGILVDVGGGIGAAAYPISEHLPGWDVVVQDRAEIVKKGKENYKQINSTAKVEFEEADFFREQPPHRIRTADAYFLRYILHDWPTNQCVQILINLRKAAKPTTRLLICEMSLAAPPVGGDLPILSNGGMAASLFHYADLATLTLFNAKERSQEEFSEIFDKSGWILIEATPVALLDRFIFEGVPNPTWK